MYMHTSMSCNWLMWHIHQRLEPILSGKAWLMLNFGNHQVKVRGGLVHVVMTRGCFLLLEVSCGHVQFLAACSEVSGSHLSERSETRLDHPWDGRTKQLPWTKEAGDQIQIADVEVFSSPQEPVLRISGRQLGIPQLNSILTLTTWS